MVLPFFGKKSNSGNKGADAVSGGGPGDFTTLGFTQSGGSDGRGALADAAGKIEIVEAGVDDVAAIEEAAVLYANANESGAKAVLEEAVKGAGRQSDRLWRMLFDLYRLCGDRSGFDAHGVVFAQLFEKSPPIWDEATPVAPVAAPRDASPAVNLSGNLSGNARAQFEQLIRIGTKTGKLRIDFSRLKGIDESGSTLLSDTLAELKRARVKVALLGARQAFGLLEPQVKVGEPVGRVFWLCALSMLQQLGEQERFEDMAINFAVTFEESPPSWDPPEILETPQPVAAPEPAPEPAGGSERRGFLLQGVIGGAKPEVIGEITTYASDRKLVEIDASGLKRLEFVSAGAFFNLFAGFQAKGRRTLIRHPNEMVAALMRVMGIDQVAEIEYKKF